jgi:hypothetical protein
MLFLILSTDLQLFMKNKTKHLKTSELLWKVERFKQPVVSLYPRLLYYLAYEHYIFQ